MPGPPQLLGARQDPTPGPSSPGSVPGPETPLGVSQALVDALIEGNVALKDANTALRELVTSLQNERRLLVDKNNELEAKLDLHLSKNLEIETVRFNILYCARIP